jgi:hypothetical protein
MVGWLIRRRWARPPIVSGPSRLQRPQQQLLGRLDRQVVSLEHRRGVGLQAVGQPLEPAAEKGGSQVGERVGGHGGLSSI